MMLMEGNMLKILKIIINKKKGIRNKRANQNMIRLSTIRDRSYRGVKVRQIQLRMKMNKELMTAKEMKHIYLRTNKQNRQ